MLYLLLVPVLAAAGLLSSWLVKLPDVAACGQGLFGAEAAARHHFEKSAAELTEDEAALLAALLPSPRRNDPIRHPSLLIKRQEAILGWMHRENGDQLPTAAY